MSTIVTRAGKGSALSALEMDTNLNNLNNDKLEKSGGTLSGALVLAGDPTVALNPSTKQYTDTGDKILQIVHFETSAFVAGTALIPSDDTIPQNTEGTQVMSLAITPKLADSYLLIEVSHPVTAPIAWCVSALFRDAGVNAVGLGLWYESVATASKWITYTIKVPSVAAILTTFNVRIGGNTAGTFAINGQSARLYGGLSVSSIRITEVRS